MPPLGVLGTGDFNGFPIAEKWGDRHTPRARVMDFSGVNLWAAGDLMAAQFSRNGAINLSAG